MKRKPPLDQKDQVVIGVVCIAVAIIIWIILFSLLSVSEIFVFILLAYNIIGGLLNKDMAQSKKAAIFFAPMYIGNKMALYAQAVANEGKLHEMTAEELVELNRQIRNDLEGHKNKNEVLWPCVFACMTYGELADFNESVIDRYKKITSSDKKAKPTANLAELTAAEKQLLFKEEAVIDDKTVGYSEVFERAKRGDMDSMLLMAYACAAKLENHQKSFYWFKKIVDADSDAWKTAESLYWLGQFFRAGLGVEQDKVKGVSLVIEAAKRGSVIATRALHKDGIMTIAELRDLGVTTEMLRNAGVIE